MPAHCNRCRRSFLIDVQSLSAGAARCQQCREDMRILAGCTYQWLDKQHFEEIEKAVRAELVPGAAEEILKTLAMVAEGEPALRQTFRELLRRLPSVAILRAAASPDPGFLYRVRDMLATILTAHVAPGR